MVGGGRPVRPTEPAQGSGRGFHLAPGSDAMADRRVAVSALAVRRALRPIMFPCRLGWMQCARVAVGAAEQLLLDVSQVPTVQ